MVDGCPQQPRNAQRNPSGKTLRLSIAAAGIALQGAAFAFNSDRDDVREAYLGEPTVAKRTVALEGINELLSAQMQLPGGGGGAIFGSGDLTSTAGTILSNPPPPVTIVVTTNASADADLGPLGDPMMLDGVRVNVLADFASPRNATIGAGGAVINTNMHTLTLSGMLTNAGPLIKQGAGTLRLTGANVWTPVVSGSGTRPPIYLSDGTLSGTTASLQADIEVRGALFSGSTTIEFDQDFDGLYNGAVNGDVTTALRVDTDLIKRGSGKLTLTQRNHFGIGETRVTSGELALTGSGSTGTGALFVGAGAVVDISGSDAPVPGTISGGAHVGAPSGSGEIRLGDRTLLIETRDDAVWDGVVSGSGGVIYDGQGRSVITLTAAQTYTGDSTVRDATVALLGTGSFETGGRIILDSSTLDLVGADDSREIGSLAGDGVVKLGANDLTVGRTGAPVDFAGRFTGSGDLHKLGEGTWTLRDGSQHTGTTHIEAGRIVTSASGISDRVVNNGELELSRDDESTLPIDAYSGNISGTGRFIKSGNGVVWLRGSNSYTGGTSIEAGVLVGNTDSITGDIDNHGAVAFYQIENGRYAGQLRGDGALLIFGPGELELAGNNRTYSGDTLFSGILRVAAAGALGAAGSNLAFVGGDLRLAGDVTSDQNLYVAAAGGSVHTGEHIFDIRGELTGIGALRKTGSGTMRIDGQHGNFLGSLEIAAGRAMLNGELGGGLHFAPGTVFEVQATPGTANHVSLTGPDAKAMLEGADVAVTAAGDFPRRTAYTLITTTGGIDGAFENVAVDQADLSAALTYTPEKVLLTLFRNDVPLDVLGTSRAQKIVGRTLFGFLSPDGDPQIAAAYSGINALSDDDMPLALESIAGLSHAGTSQVLGQGQRAINQLVTQRLDAVAGSVAEFRAGGSALFAGSALGLAARSEQTRHGAWLRGFGGTGDFDTDSDFDDQSLQFGGVAAGVDVALNTATSLGIVSVFSESTLDQARPFAETRIDAWLIGGYGRWRAAALYVDGIATYARHGFKSTRTLELGPSASDVSASYDGSTWNVRAETGYAIARRITWAPFVALQYARHDTDAFAERGGPLALAVADNHEDSLRSQLGVRFTAPIQSSAARELTAFAFAAWSHEFADAGTLNAFLTGDPAATNLRLAGSTVADDTATFGAGVQLRAGARTRLFAGFNGEVNSKQTLFGANAGLRLSW